MNTTATGGHDPVFGFFPNARFNKDLQNWLIGHCLFDVRRIARLETAHPISAAQGNQPCPQTCPLSAGYFLVLYFSKLPFCLSQHDMKYSRNLTVSFRPKFGYSCSQLAMRALGTSYLRCTKDKSILSWKLPHPLHTSENTVISRRREVAAHLEFTAGDYLP